jgi:hypothetical protein
MIYMKLAKLRPVVVTGKNDLSFSTRYYNHIIQERGVMVAGAGVSAVFRMIDS